VVVWPVTRGFLLLLLRWRGLTPPGLAAAIASRCRSARPRTVVEWSVLPRRADLGALPSPGNGGVLPGLPQPPGAHEHGRKPRIRRGFLWSGRPGSNPRHNTWLGESTRGFSAIPVLPGSSSIEPGTASRSCSAYPVSPASPFQVRSIPTCKRAPGRKRTLAPPTHVVAHEPRPRHDPACAAERCGPGVRGASRTLYRFVRE
jgi:hypothetical protein